LAPITPRRAVWPFVREVDACVSDHPHA